LVSPVSTGFYLQGHQESCLHWPKRNRVISLRIGSAFAGDKDIPALKKNKNYFKGIKGIRKDRIIFMYFLLWSCLSLSWIARKSTDTCFICPGKMDENHRFLPTDYLDILAYRITLDIINNINKKLVIYYCIDNFLLVPGAKKIRIARRSFETSRLVFVTSQALYDYCRKENNNVHIFPFG